MKVGKEIITFGDIESEKNFFFFEYQYRQKSYSIISIILIISKTKISIPPKKSYCLNDVDIEKIPVSNNISSSLKTLSTLFTCIMIMKLNYYM